MKVRLTEDEDYPILRINDYDAFGIEVDLPDDIVQLAEHADRAWAAVQSILWRYVRAKETGREEIR